MLIIKMEQALAARLVQSGHRQDDVVTGELGLASDLGFHSGEEPGGFFDWMRQSVGIGRVAGVVR